MEKLTGLLLLGMLGFITAQDNYDVFDDTMVTQWPQSSAFQVGQEGRLNFTLKTGAVFKIVSLDANFVGEANIKNIYSADPTEAVIADGMEADFMKVPDMKHDVKLNKMKWTLAGTYLAKVKISLSLESVRVLKITAIDAGQCSNSGGEDEEDGVIVNLDCKVQYNGPLVPRMKWKNSQGIELPGWKFVQEQPGDGDKPTTTTVSPLLPKTIIWRANVTANKDNDQEVFACDVFFDDDIVDGKPQKIEYTDNCNTSFGVQFGVTSMMFEPEPVGDVSYFKVGDTMNCTARGNPEPTFSWLGQSINNAHGFVDGPILTMTADMVGGTNEYKCTARNKLKNNQPFDISRTVKFEVTHKPASGASRLMSGAVLLCLLAVCGIRFA